MTATPTKTSAIIVTAQFVVRYDKSIFGEAGAAENAVTKLRTAMEQSVDGEPRAKMTKWLPRFGRVTG